MSLTETLHLVAGLGALALGGGVLLREPGRARNRHFALLCAALALWNAGLAIHRLATPAAQPTTRMVYLLGSCASGPLALQFVFGLVGLQQRTRRRALVATGVLAAWLWATGSFLLTDDRVAWSVTAIVVLGGMLAVALLVLGRHVRRLPRGPERRAHLLVLWGGLVAVVGGLTDFVPRGEWDVMRLGPLTVLLFLLTVCAVIVRHRFLDVDVFLVRAVSLLAGAAATGLTFFGVVRYVDPQARFATLFLTSVVLLALAVPLGRMILTRARSLLAPADPVAGALQQVSRRLTDAGHADEVWRIFEEGRTALPGDVRLQIHVRRSEQQRFHPFFDAGGEGHTRPEPVPADAAVPHLLALERMPLTRRYLRSEAHEAAGQRRELAREALAWLAEHDLRLLVPILRGERLVGWIGAGGGMADRYLTAEVATAFLAVGHQTLASLERIEALETARRGERLAAVGELAAGLAHEVRNPVAAIRGAAQALGPQATAEQREEMLQVIAEESERLGRFVGEFLDWARPVSPRRAAVDLAALLRRSAKAHELAGRRIALAVDDADAAPRALGDPDLLLRAIDNLLRNAWEAAGDGVNVRASVHAVETGRLALRVEDDGPGIEPAAMRSLFRPFHSTKPGGTGLGLALIHRIVEVHGGEVRVEGRPGIGAAFTLLLPRAGENPGDRAATGNF